jgi:hypothetical protein
MPEKKKKDRKKRKKKRRNRVHGLELWAQTVLAAACCCPKLEKAAGAGKSHVVASASVAMLSVILALHLHPPANRVDRPIPAKTRSTSTRQTIRIRLAAVLEVCAVAPQGCIQVQC